MTKNDLEITKKYEEIDRLKYENIEKIQEEIDNAKTQSNTVKVELLKYYLLHYILYINKKEKDDECPIKEELLKISVLLEKLINMEKKLAIADSKRLASVQMMKNKTNNEKKGITPSKRFKKNYDKLQDKLAVKEHKKDNSKQSNKFL